MTLARYANVLAHAACGVLRFGAMKWLNGALDGGPQPLELPIEVPAEAPEMRRPKAVEQRPGRNNSRTRIEIDLVVTDDGEGRHDDADDASRGNVIEIDLA